MRSAMLKPHIATAMFPVSRASETDHTNQSNMSKRRVETTKTSRKPSSTSEDFGDDGIEDDELMRASFGNLEFDSIEDYADPFNPIGQQKKTKTILTIDRRDARNNSSAALTNMAAKDKYMEPTQLSNGRWACNHSCKDKSICKHLCCRNGMEKPPKKKYMTKPTSVDGCQPQPSNVETGHKRIETQPKLQFNVSKRKNSSTVDEIDLTQQEKKKTKSSHITTRHEICSELRQRHSSTQGHELPSSLGSVMNKKPDYSYSQGDGHIFSFMDDRLKKPSQTSSDYGDIPFDEIQQSQYQHALNHEEYIGYMKDPVIVSVPHHGSDSFGDDDSLLDVIVGLVDSQNLQTAAGEKNDAMSAYEEALSFEDEASYQTKSISTDTKFRHNETDDFNVAESILGASKISAPETLPNKSRSPLESAPSNTQITLNDIQLPYTTIKAKKPKSLSGPLPVWFSESGDKNSNNDGDGTLDVFDMPNDVLVKDVAVKAMPTSETVQGLELWLLQEFGDIIELIYE